MIGVELKDAIVREGSEIDKDLEYHEGQALVKNIRLSFSCFVTHNETASRQTEQCGKAKATKQKRLHHQSEGLAFSLFAYEEVAVNSEVLP